MMRDLRWTAPGLAVWFACLAAGALAEGDQPRVDRTLAKLGGESFQQYCASCHGTDGRGDGPVADSLKTPPADLTRIAARRGGTFPAGEIASYIDGRFEVDAHGTREMPIWGHRFGKTIRHATLGEEVTRGRIYSLVEYLKSIQREG